MDVVDEGLVPSAGIVSSSGGGVMPPIQSKIDLNTHFYELLGGNLEGAVTALPCKSPSWLSAKRALAPVLFHDPIRERAANRGPWPLRRDVALRRPRSSGAAPDCVRGSGEVWLVASAVRLLELARV
jgi:hypothetical protein